MIRYESIVSGLAGILIRYSSSLASCEILSLQTMVKYYDQIPDFAIPWIQEQKIFWVATAPLTPDGHVNVSPKGIFEGSFNIVNPNRVWYEDFTGSGKCHVPILAVWHPLNYLMNG